jgi:hypothetical protein
MIEQTKQEVEQHYSVANGYQNDAQVNTVFCFITDDDMKTYGGEWVYLQMFLTFPLHAGMWPGCLNPQGKSPPSTHHIGGWVNPKCSLDAVANTKYPGSFGNQIPVARSLCSGLCLC